jgi:hypothetical protein
MRKASSLNNPKRGVSANKGIRTSLANPTATQRQFQARSARRASRSGGFGRSSRQGRTTRSGGFGRSGTRRRSSSSRGFSTSRGGYGGFGK